MNEEMAMQLKKDLLATLLTYYRKCQIHIRFIDDYDVLQITLVRQITPCTKWMFNQIYLDPIVNLSYSPLYSTRVASDFTDKANKWIKMQFTGGKVS